MGNGFLEQVQTSRIKAIVWLTSVVFFVSIAGADCLDFGLHCNLQGLVVLRAAFPVKFEHCIHTTGCDVGNKLLLIKIILPIQCNSLDLDVALLLGGDGKAGKQVVWGEHPRNSGRAC